jgi:hypothetical protein
MKSAVHCYQIFKLAGAQFKMLLETVTNTNTRHCGKCKKFYHRKHTCIRPKDKEKPHVPEGKRKRIKFVTGSRSAPIMLHEWDILEYFYCESCKLFFSPATIEEYKVLTHSQNTKSYWCISCQVPLEELYDWQSMAEKGAQARCEECNILTTPQFMYYDENTGVLRHRCGKEVEVDTVKL